jgi:hypothetical protein
MSNGVIDGGTAINGGMLNIFANTNLANAIVDDGEIKGI